MGCELRRLNRIIAVIILSVLFGFLSCPDSLSFYDTHNIPDGMGAVSISFSGVSRTVLPATPLLSDFSEFEFIFTAVSGGTGKTETLSYGAPYTIYLMPGTYSLTVNAYMGTGTSKVKVASSDAQTVAVIEGINNTASVLLKALFGEGAGNGTFTYSITIGTGVTLDSDGTMRILKNGELQGSSITINKTGTTTGERTLASGLYTLEITLEDEDGKTIVWKKLLHVYAALTSNYTITFTQNYFNSPIHEVNFYIDGTVKGTLTFLHGEALSSDDFPGVNQDKTAYLYLNASIPSTPGWEPGYKFSGWFTQADGAGTKYAALSKVHTSLNLYAHWTTDCITAVYSRTVATETNDFEKAIGYVKANPGEYTLYVADDIAISPQVIIVANIKLTLIGAGGSARTISLSQLTGAMFSIANAELTLNNIVLQGCYENDNSFILIENNAKLIMLTGSSITGNTINYQEVGDGVYAVEINGGTLNIKGGSITGNDGFETKNKSVAVMIDGGNLIMESGNIKSNADVNDVSVKGNSTILLSGNSTIGSIAISNDYNNNNYPFITVDLEWTGSISTAINLICDDNQSLANTWENKIILAGLGVTSQLVNNLNGKLGVYINNLTTATIFDTHELVLEDDKGVLKKFPPFDYEITESSGTFTVKRGDRTVASASDSNAMVTVINAICTDAKGIDCKIQFGSGGDNVLNTGNRTLYFSGMNGWGKITLTGKITSSSTWTVGICHNINVETFADINNTGSTGCSALYLQDSANVEVKGGTISAAGGIAINNTSTGTVTISGDTTEITAVTDSETIYNNGGTVIVEGGTISNTISSSSNTTRAVIRNASGTLTISSGTVKNENTTWCRVIENSGTLNVNGNGSIEAEGTSANGIYILEGTVTISEQAVVKSTNDRNSDTMRGTIYITDSSPSSTRLEIKGGTVENAIDTANARAITNYSAGTVEITGGTIKNTGDDANAITIVNIKTGTLQISGGTINASAGVAGVAIQSIDSDANITLSGTPTITGRIQSVASDTSANLTVQSSFNPAGKYILDFGAIDDSMIGYVAVKNGASNISNFELYNQTDYKLETSQSNIVIAEAVLEDGTTPETAFKLTEGVWMDGVLEAADSEVWYYFDTEVDENYYLFWNDNYDGDNSKTADILVSASYNDNSIIDINNNDNGWHSLNSLKATKTKVLLKVSGFNGSTGDFAITYYQMNSFFNSLDAVYLDTMDDNELTDNKNIIWYYFNVTAGVTYYVWWDDNTNSAYCSGTKSGDILVSAMYSDGTVIFADKDTSWERVSGSTSYPVQPFTPVSTGKVFLKVIPRLKTTLGTFGIAYTTDNNNPFDN